MVRECLAPLGHGVVTGEQVDGEDEAEDETWINSPIRGRARGGANHDERTGARVTVRRIDQHRRRACRDRRRERVAASSAGTDDHDLHSTTPNSDGRVRIGSTVVGLRSQCRAIDERMSAHLEAGRCANPGTCAYSRCRRRLPSSCHSHQPRTWPPRCGCGFARTSASATVSPGTLSMGWSSITKRIRPSECGCVADGDRVAAELIKRDVTANDPTVGRARERWLGGDADVAEETWATRVEHAPARGVHRLWRRS